MMSFCVCHGYEEVNLRENEKYSNFKLDLSDEAQQYHEETDSLLKPLPFSTEKIGNTNRPKFATKKKSWTKYFSYLSKFTKQSKASSQKKQASYSFTWKSKLGQKFGSATGIACKLASIQEAIRKRASGPSVRSFHPTKQQEIVPHIQLENIGVYAFRREAFGPIYMVT